MSTPPATRTRERDRGSAAIEFAITAAVVIALMFTAVQVTLVSLARSVAQEAAREAADAERGFQARPGAGPDRAAEFLATTGDLLTAPTVQVSHTADGVTATVTGTSLSVIPGFAGFTVAHTVHGVAERVQDDNP